MGKAAIFNPYLDTLGGGERYTLSFAKVLADIGWKVDVEWKAVGIKLKLEERLGLDLGKINIVADVKKGSGYDLCFWVSDGSIPLLHARKNILHFQVPFHNIDGKSLFNKMKLFRINKVVCNSVFTKSIIDQEYGINSLVLYPPVDVAKIKPKRKENIILYVGRFSQLAQVKRQDILIKAFKVFSKSNPDWKLVLAGGVEVGVGDYLENLIEKSKDRNIEIIKSPDFKSLLDLYGKSRLFWSAAGYGINEKKEPEKVEHFGITIVEAMAAGAVPLVFNAGGAKEIIENGKSGFLWNKESELISISKMLVVNSKLLREMSARALNDAGKFGYEVFNKEVTSLI